MQHANYSAVYRDASINTASPLKLVVMLYQGAIRFLKQAREATLAKDVQAKSQAVDRAVAILQHLQGTLD